MIFISITNISRALIIFKNIASRLPRSVAHITAKKPNGRALGSIYLPKIKLKNSDRSSNVNISMSCVTFASTDILSKYR